MEDFWNEKDLEGTNGQPGWYNGEIQHFHEENGAIYAVCFKDRAVYSLHATGALVDGIIHSIQALVRRTATPFIIYGYTTFARTMKQHYLY